MKKTLVKSMALAFVGSLLVAGSALALPIVGNISLSSVDGTALSPQGGNLATATGINFDLNAQNMQVDTADGSFSPVLGKVGKINDFVFSPSLSGNITPFWTVSNGEATPIVFSYDLVSVDYTSQAASGGDGSGFLTVAGTGLMHGTGFDDTASSWIYQANGKEGSYSWASSTNMPAPVPEPATMLLLGTGLAGLAGANRRRRANKNVA